MCCAAPMMSSSAIPSSMHAVLSGCEPLGDDRRGVLNSSGSCHLPQFLRVPVIVQWYAASTGTVYQ